MAKRPTPPDPDKEGAQKTEITENTVPINVGMDKDGEPLPAAAKAAIADKDKPGLSGSTRAAMPGGSNTDDPLSDGGLHTVTINGKTYSWRDGDEASVPAEAVAVYERAREANTP